MTARIRIEWVRGSQVFGAHEMNVGAVSVQSEAPPDFHGVGGFARITVLGGAVLLNVDEDPTASSETSQRYAAGQDPVVYRINEGWKVAAIEATYGVTPTDRSGSITAGGASQTLAAANPARRGYSVQNTSSGPLRVSASVDPGAAAGYEIQPGQLYESPAHGSPAGELKIWGATTGQTFIAEEW